MSSLQAPAGLMPSASYSFTMRIELRQLPGAFAQVAGAIGTEGAILGAIDLVRVDSGGVTRDVTISCVDAAHGELGLGDIGPEAAMPVMEGKAMLFKELAGVDAFPLCLDTTDVDEIVRIVEGVAPTFGGINLEDIAAPRCFEVERRLKETLDIPVFHDDQHGTAIVVLAALLNALRVVGKRA